MCIYNSSNETGLKQINYQKQTLRPVDLTIAEFLIKINHSDTTT